jgi:ribosome-dependent ATPase
MLPHAEAFPAMYFLNIAIGTFSKGLGAASFFKEYVMLALFWLAFFVASLLFLKKQKA